jgi:hypothetical protein
MTMQSKTSKPTKKRAKAQVTATAVHAEHKDGIHHLVGLGNIRVLLVPDGDGWFAQGLEIDYAAQGDSLSSAKREFEDGLTATVHAHLKHNGHIQELLKTAPNEAWDLASDPSVKLKRYSQVTQHHIIREKSNYEGIAYLIAAKSTEGPGDVCQ